MRPGQIMASMFYEPSTRTRLSFEAAMHRLGGKVIGFSDVRTTSVAKGETLADTVRIVNGYADVLVIRNPWEGSALVAALHSQAPVINAGDGGREHPTQCLVDLFTLRREKGRIEGLRVGLLGDLKFGRTVHSLAQGLARFGAEVVCISPEPLRMPRRVLDFVEQLTGRRPAEVAQPEEVLDQLDALYVTRIQRERFDDPAEYEALKGCYVVTSAMMRNARADTIVLHPLPRVDEIAPEFDSDPRAAYFRQAHYGVPTRMALLGIMLARAEAEEKWEPDWPEDARCVVSQKRLCDNPRCVTAFEPHLEFRLERLDDGQLRCVYCDALVEQRELKLEAK